jgi:salicylate hydroxylase
MSDWVHPSGRTVIIGDAVHATLPYLAQGAAMAIEDAATLGSVLSHVDSIDDLPRLLNFFYGLRINRVHSIQRGSWTNRFFIHMGDGPMLDMRESIFKAGDYPGSPNLMGNTLFQDYLYGFDATAYAENAYEARFGAKL